MELFFTDSSFKVDGVPSPRIPFIVDKNMKLVIDANDYLKFVTENGKTQSPKTWSAYAAHLIDFLKWLEFRSLSWDLVGRQQVASYRDWSLKDNAISTVNKKLGVLFAFYNFQVKKGGIETNPLNEVSSKSYYPIDADSMGHVRAQPLRVKSKIDLTLREANPLPKIFSHQELVKLFQASPCDFISLTMRLMLETGMRREEVFLLELAEIKNVEKRLMQNFLEGTQVELNLIHTKNKMPRTVFISMGLASSMRQWRLTARSKLDKIYRKKRNYVAVAQS